MLDRRRPDREDLSFLGILLCVLGLLWFAFAYQACAPSYGRCNVLEGISEWQTLLTGVLATAAAVITIFQVREQIRAADTASRHDRARKAASHRALLPLVLSDVCDFVEDDNKKLATALKSGTEPTPLEWPEAISGQFDTFRSVVEFDDENTLHSRKLTALLSQLQIYRARRRPKGIGSTGRIEILDRIRDAAEIYASASELFDYARGEDFRHKSDRETMVRTVRILGYWDGIDNDVFEHIDRRYPPESGDGSL